MKKQAKFETSKVLAIYLLILFTVVIVYSMAAIWYFGDLSYLNILISDIAAQILTYIVYCVKAYKAKQSEEELIFKKDLAEKQSITETTISNDNIVG